MFLRYVCIFHVCHISVSISIYLKQLLAIRGITQMLAIILKIKT